MPLERRYITKRLWVSPAPAVLVHVRVGASGSGEGQANGSRADHAAQPAAAKMRRTPEHPVIAPHEVSAHVVQPGRLPAARFGAAGMGFRDRAERGAHFDVIEQGRAAMRNPLAIECRPANRQRSSRVLGGQQ